MFEQRPFRMMLEVLLWRWRWTWSSTEKSALNR